MAKRAEETESASCELIQQELYIPGMPKVIWFQVKQFFNNIRFGSYQYFHIQRFVKPHKAIIGYCFDDIPYFKPSLIWEKLFPVSQQPWTDLNEILALVLLDSV